MRFTKIPLIATLMAVALSLLIVLPTIAQTTDITDGKLSAGDITVGVFANIGDAEPHEVGRMGTWTHNQAPPQSGVFIPIEPEPDALRHGGTTPGVHSCDDRTPPT